MTEEIHYFTAHAEHLHRENPEKIERHKSYVRALTANKVKTECAPQIHLYTSLSPLPPDPYS